MSYEPLHVVFGFMVDELEVFRILALFQAWSRHWQCNKFCSNLPKNKTLKHHQKLRFYYFSKIIIFTCRKGTRACFHCLDFQSKNFSYAIFLVKKRPLYVNFSIPPCGNWWFSQGSTPHVDMRFCGHVPNSPRNKNPKRQISYLLERVVFLDSKWLLSPLSREKKKIFIQLWMLWSCKL
jgi:hypothetical protein